MSRNILIVAVIALILGAGALILQFALPSGGGVDEAALQALEKRVEGLEMGASLLRIGYFNVEQSFKDALYPLSETQRQKAMLKAEDIQSLYIQRQNEHISMEEFTTKNMELQVEYLQAQINTIGDTLRKMIEVTGLLDLDARLEAQQVQEAAEKLEAVVDSLVQRARIGVVNQAEFEQLLAQTHNDFEVIDKMISRVAAYVIAKEAKNYGIENNYDLVFAEKNSLIYGNPAKTVDITASIVLRISAFFD